MGNCMNKDNDKNIVAFIICSNNEQYLQECIRYLSFLKVPEGIETDVITIQDAKSMASGYQAAMTESDAKYKVYLHQEVFILNENFISDCIKIFQEYPEYGLLGVVGSDKRITDAAYWDKWNLGAVDACNSDGAMRLKLDGAICDNKQKSVKKADAIDGLIMITQYDVNWREDIFHGFDFYDISQSMEFQKAGYQVGVICQDIPWCYHDCGFSKLFEYDKERKVFCDTYKEEGFTYQTYQPLEDTCRRNKKAEAAVAEVEQCLIKHQAEQAKEMAEDIRKRGAFHTRLMLLSILSDISEAQKNKKVQGFDFENDTVDELIQKYNYYKFFLRRLEYEKPYEDMMDVAEWIRVCDLSFDVGCIVSEHSIMKFVKVAEKINLILQKD